MRTRSLFRTCLSPALAALVAGSAGATELSAGQRRDMSEIQARYAAELQPAYEQAAKSRTLIEYLNASGKFDEAEIAQLAALYAEAVERMIVLHSRMNGELAAVVKPDPAGAPSADPQRTDDTADLRRLPRAPRALDGPGSISMFN